MVQEMVTYVDQLPDKATQLELIDTLRSITEGKVLEFGRSVMVYHCVRSMWKWNVLV